MTILQIVPTGSQSLYAVFTDEHGVPHFRLVAAMGIVEVDPGSGDGRVLPTRVVTSFPVDGSHLEMADFNRFHVGYTADPTSDPLIGESWSDRCRAKLEKLKEAEDAARAQKILVPEKKKLEVFQN